MSNKELPLYFPSGLSIRRAKGQAKGEYKQEKYSSLTTAQDALAQREMQLPWAKAINHIKNHQSFMTIEDIKSVMLELSDLTLFGFGASWGPEQTLDKYLKDVDKYKKELLTSVNQCNRACQYLQHVTKRKTINQNIGSYGHKHSVERYLRVRYPKQNSSNCYVSNGAFICAAHFMGFDIKRNKSGNPNGCINYSEKSPIVLWRDLHERKSFLNVKEVKFMKELEEKLGLPESKTEVNYF